jgi:hypothetical protein
MARITRIKILCIRVIRAIRGCPSFGAENNQFRAGCSGDVRAGQKK